MNEARLRMRAGSVLPLACARGLAEAMCVIESIWRAHAGAGLITITVVKRVACADHAVYALELERVWSSQLHAYPVHGSKYKPMTPWTRQVFCKNRVFRAEGDAALKETFDDSALILSLGLHAAINVPLLERDGRCRAAFNILGSRPAWTHGDVLLIEHLAALAAPFVAQHLAHFADKA